jgi:hypothetical protein
MECLGVANQCVVVIIAVTLNVMLQSDQVSHYTTRNVSVGKFRLCVQQTISLLVYYAGSAQF